uniref:Serine protease K12H4.7 n=1 Tax=Acrobeloides nanus TaxID=290746 RepID=A0A914BX81_9BILA
MDSRLFLTLLLFFVCIASTLSLSPKRKLNFRRRLLINGRPWHGLKPSKHVFTPESKDGAPKAQWFYQKVDHVGSANTDYYWQRYWNNSNFYKPGGPAFLMIGGESAQTAWWVEDETLQWLKLAKQHNAITFLLEHRFYGSTQPTNGDMSTDSLEYLSSEQAIEDVAYFIRSMNSKLNLTSAKWIVFGGSYAGALAAWARAKHPDIIYGAVASSAPVQPVVDFTGYLEVIEDGLNNYNPECGSSLHQGLLATYNLIGNPSGRQQLFKGFQLCEYIDYANKEQISYFFLDLIGLYMTVVQYSGDNVLNYNTNVNIPSICAYHLQRNKTDLQKLQEVNSFFMQFYQESCLDVNYESYIAYLQEANDDKAWVYQTCNEFGYYQSTTSTKANQFYGNVLPVELCEYIDYANKEQISYFFLDLIGLYMTVVQYSGDNVLNYNTNVNIPSICAYHLQRNKTDLQKLQEVNSFFMQFYQESCLDVNYESYIAYLQEANDDKAWVYQTCNEFGYYQSTTSTKANQFYGNVLPVDWFIRQCELIYGSKFANGSVYNNVDKTNSIYHGKAGYNATRVVLPNGTNDPWHLPAILTSPNNESYAIVIQGTSHVADVYPDAASDPLAVKQARIEIAQHVKDWLKN